MGKNGIGCGPRVVGPDSGPTGKRKISGEKRSHRQARNHPPGRPKISETINIGVGTDRVLLSRPSWP